MKMTLNLVELPSGSFYTGYFRYRKDRPTNNELDRLRGVFGRQVYAEFGKRVPNGAVPQVEVFTDASGVRYFCLWTPA